MMEKKLINENVVLYMLVLLMGITVVFMGVFPFYEAICIKEKTFNDEILSFANYSSVGKEEDNAQLFATVCAEEMILSTDMSVMQTERNEQKASVSNLKSKESYVLNPYPIITKSNSLSAAYSTTDMGTMYCNSVGLSLRLVYTDSQATVNSPYYGVVQTQAISSSPIGVPGGCSFVGDHNYQTGYLMGRARIGDKIYVKTPYGQFLYQIYRIGTASCDGYDFYMNDDGMRVIGAVEAGQLQGLVFFTCYPFNSLSGAQRYMVFAKLIDGTVLS